MGSCCYSDSGQKNNLIVMQKYDKKLVEEFVVFWKNNSDMRSISKNAIIKAFEFYNKIYKQDNQNIHDARNIQYVAKNLNYLYFLYQNREIEFETPPPLIVGTEEKPFVPINKRQPKKEV